VPTTVPRPVKADATMVDFWSPGTVPSDTRMITNANVSPSPTTRIAPAAEMTPVIPPS